MEYKLTKIEVAVDQLDWAIKLLLDHSAYVPAIALAGAAEEILGKGLDGKAIFAILKKKFAAQFEEKEEVISQQYLNKTKNWIKHWNKKTDASEIWIDLEADAVHYIVRAIVNSVMYDNSLPSEGVRFFKWLNINRKRLNLEEFPVIDFLASIEN